jgi:hypothetical protein
MICDLCDRVAHTYCCGFYDSEFPDDWVCRECERLQNGDDSSDESEEGDSESSSSEVERWLLNRFSRVLT